MVVNIIRMGIPDFGVLFPVIIGLSNFAAFVHPATPNVTGTPLSQEILQPGAEECVSFTRLLGRIKKDYALQQLTNITDLECQDKCIFLTACQSFSFGILDNGLTECMLSQYNRHSQTNLFNDNGLIQNFAYYEKSREGCMELAFECGPDRIVVQGRSTEPFSGLVYPEGIFEKSCQADLSNQRNFTLEIPLQGTCGTRYTGNGLYENVIIIQWDDLIVTRRDRRFKISCQYDLSDLEISHKPMEIGQMTPMEMSLKVPRPDPVIRLINMDANDVNVARVGDNMVFRVELSKASPYGIFARNCRAQGENPSEFLDLINDKGCPLHPEVFPQLQRNGSALETQFLAFRFRKSFQVFYQCTIDYCVDACPPADCTGIKSFGRRKKRESATEIPSADSVKNTLIILDDIPTRNLAQVSHSKLNSSVLVYPTPPAATCDATYQLIAIVLAVIAGSFFVLLIAMIVFFLMTNKRSRRPSSYYATAASKEFAYPNHYVTRK
ncbi:uncharacterized protein LOC129583667 [Paramacrobiotus metropolitanus]|uniref:uncharacterized protein LOC129583667 n=1 Tax=Paramacrobiotus metropolitanus TaxID=2943436 RepID=UPI002445C1B6|nr:uncharacterized protein LOC129583667 [Paramacrobiotus metropolitanus]